MVSCAASHDGYMTGSLCCGKTTSGGTASWYEFNDPGVNQEGSGSYDTCADLSDNDCDGERDYDGVSGSTKGESSCPVGIDGISAPDYVNTVQACQSGVFTLTCDATTGGVRSITADVSGAACTFTGWSGNTASFTCPIPATDTIALARCTVNTGQSYPVPGKEFLTKNVNIDCRSKVNVKVFDEIGPVGGASVTLDGSDRQTLYTTGVASFSDILLGSHDFTVTKDGYFDARLTQYTVDQDPENIDVPFSPESCNKDCTFGQSGRCAYKCFGDGACSVGVSQEEFGRVKRLCEDRLKGTQVDFNETHVFECCRGPMVEVAELRAPLKIESCSSQLIPHTTLVMYNGKIHRLTVLSYRTCQ